MFIRRITVLSAAALLLCGLSLESSARTFSMTGAWYQNRGPVIDIPANGGPVPCSPATNSACVNLLPFTANAPLPDLIPVAGGIPGAAAAVNATGNGPATFTVPGQVFTQNLGKQVVGLPFVPTVVQLSSQFVFSGPAGGGSYLTPQGAISAMATPNDPPGVFRAGAWAAQVGRLAASFAWCPGPNNPACTGPGQAGNIYPHLVQYSNPNPNKFGGTMAMMQGGSAVVSVIIAPLAPPAFIAGHQLVGGLANLNPQAQGRGYAITDVDLLAAAPARIAVAQAPPCPGPFTVTGNCSQILASLTTGNGAFVTPTTGNGLPIFIPPDTNLNFGFPWTTGTVLVRNTGTNQGNPATTTISAMGTDMRTPLGQGQITLVAGGSSHRYGLAVGNPQEFSALDVVQMNFAAAATPSASPMGLAAGAVLMLLAVGFAARRRF
jgi:hypothetical protein